MKQNNRQYIIVILLLISTILYTKNMSHGIPVKIKLPLSDLPTEIASWKGETRHFSKEVYKKLGVDDSILRIYNDGKGRNISLYIGYYETQKRGEIIHSPKNCMIGSGWEPTNISEITINTSTGPITVTKMITQKGNSKELILYWYQSGNRYIANEYKQRLLFIHDSIRYNRTNGAFIRITSPVIDNNVDETLTTESDFIELLKPILSKYLP